MYYLRGPLADTHYYIESSKYFPSIRNAQYIPKGHNMVRAISAYRSQGLIIITLRIQFPLISYMKIFSSRCFHVGLNFRVLYTYCTYKYMYIGAIANKCTCTHIMSFHILHISTKLYYCKYSYSIKQVCVHVFDIRTSHFLYFYFTIVHYFLSNLLG